MNRSLQIIEALRGNPNNVPSYLKKARKVNFSEITIDDSNAIIAAYDNNGYRGVIIIRN